MQFDGVKYFLEGGKVWQVNTTLTDLGTQQEVFVQFFSRTLEKADEFSMPALEEWLKKFPTVTGSQVSALNLNHVTKERKQYPVFDGEVRYAIGPNQVCVAIKLGDVYPYRNKVWPIDGRLLTTWNGTLGTSYDMNLIFDATLPLFWPHPTWLIFDLARDNNNRRWAGRNVFQVFTRKKEVWTYSMPNVFDNGVLCTGNVGFPRGTMMVEAMTTWLETWLTGATSNAHLYRADRADCLLSWTMDGEHVEMYQDQTAYAVSSTLFSILQ